MEKGEIITLVSEKDKINFCGTYFFKEREFAMMNVITNRTMVIFNFPASCLPYIPYHGHHGEGGEETDIFYHYEGVMEVDVEEVSKKLLAVRLNGKQIYSD